MNSEAWPHSLRILPIYPLQEQQKDIRNIDAFSEKFALASLMKIKFPMNFNRKWVGVYLLSEPERKSSFCLVHTHLTHTFRL